MATMETFAEISRRAKTRRLNSEATRGKKLDEAVGICRSSFAGESKPLLEGEVIDSELERHGAQSAAICLRSMQESAKWPSAISIQVGRRYGFCVCAGTFRIHADPMRPMTLGSVEIGLIRRPTPSYACWSFLTLLGPYLPKTSPEV